MEFEKYDFNTRHSIESENVLLEKETGRVVAVFYNDFDLDEVLKQLEFANNFTQYPSGLVQVKHKGVNDND